MYNPKIGRWLTQDPSGTEGGMNLYAYCDNDPVNKSDPTGLRQDDDLNRYVAPNGTDRAVPLEDPRSPGEIASELQDQLSALHLKIEGGTEALQQEVLDSYLRVTGRIRNLIKQLTPNQGNPLEQQSGLNQLAAKWFSDRGQSIAPQDYVSLAVVQNALLTKLTFMLEKMQAGLTIELDPGDGSDAADGGSNGFVSPSSENPDRIHMFTAYLFQPEKQNLLDNTLAHETSHLLLNTLDLAGNWVKLTGIGPFYARQDAYFFGELLESDDSWKTVFLTQIFRLIWPSVHANFGAAPSSQSSSPASARPIVPASSSH